MTAATTDLLAPVTLVLGPQELLADRAIAEVVAAARATDPDADVLELALLEPGALGQAVSPSLFAARKVVVVRGVQELGDAALAELSAYVAAPEPDVALVLVHRGSVRGKALLEAAKSGGARVVDCPEVKKFADKLAFVRAEFSRGRRRISEGGTRALLDAVGGDLRELAGACAQLISDTTGVVDEDVVHRYYAGRADVTSFMVADQAVEGRPAESLANLRWALGSGVDPVLITAALAMALRNIARLGGAPRGLRPADLARELGMPPWKLDRVRQQLRGWTPDGVATALQAVAEADAAVKGAGDDPAYALERAVVAIVAARDQRPVSR